MQEEINQMKQASSSAFLCQEYDLEQWYLQPIGNNATFTDTTQSQLQETLGTHHFNFQSFNRMNEEKANKIKTSENAHLTRDYSPILAHEGA